MKRYRVYCEERVSVTCSFRFNISVKKIFLKKFEKKYKTSYNNSRANWSSNKYGEMVL
jgi:hypothetical protein